MPESAAMPERPQPGPRIILKLREGTATEGWLPDIVSAAGSRFGLRPTDYRLGRVFSPESPASLERPVRMAERREAARGRRYDPPRLASYSALDLGSHVWG